MTERLTSEDMRRARVRLEADDLLAQFDDIRDHPHLTAFMPGTEPGGAHLVTAATVDYWEARLAISDFEFYPEILDRIAPHAERVASLISTLESSNYSDEYKAAVLARLGVLAAEAAPIV